MTIEVTKPYNRFQQRMNENARVINICGNNYNFNVLVGLTYRQPMGGDITREFMYGGEESIYRATIAVGVNYLGDMRLIKNRYGCDSQNGELIVRQALVDSLMYIGLNTYEIGQVMCEFNKCVSEITDEPIITNILFPYGISYRQHMTMGRTMGLVKKCNIKKHKF